MMRDIRVSFVINTIYTVSMTSLLKQDQETTIKFDPIHDHFNGIDSNLMDLEIITSVFFFF